MAEHTTKSPYAPSSLVPDNLISNNYKEMRNGRQETDTEEREGKTQKQQQHQIIS